MNYLNVYRITRSQPKVRRKTRQQLLINLLAFEVQVSQLESGTHTCKSYF